MRAALQWRRGGMRAMAFRTATSMCNEFFFFFFFFLFQTTVLQAAVAALGKRDDPRKHTVLIDGSPLIFRAHFGIDSVLSRKDGTVVTAVFGFTRLLLKLREVIEADYVGVFLDDRSQTFRKEMFDSYKSHRKTLPESLIKQIEIVEEASRACGLYTTKMAGFEAGIIIYFLKKKKKKKTEKQKRKKNG
jgi:5'-3' exonuclease